MYVDLKIHICFVTKAPVRSMLFRAMVTINFQNHMTPINTLGLKNVECYDLKVYGSLEYNPTL